MEEVVADSSSESDDDSEDDDDPESAAEEAEEDEEEEDEEEEEASFFRTVCFAGGYRCVNCAFGSIRGFGMTCCCCNTFGGVRDWSCGGVGDDAALASGGCFACSCGGGCWWSGCCGSSLAGGCSFGGVCASTFDGDGFGMACRPGLRRCGEKSSLESDDSAGFTNGGGFFFGDGPRGGRNTGTGE